MTAIEPTPRSHFLADNLEAPQIPAILYANIDLAARSFSRAAPAATIGRRSEAGSAWPPFRPWGSGFDLL
jgi:hypothetical protein